MPSSSRSVRSEIPDEPDGSTQHYDETAGSIAADDEERTMLARAEADALVQEAKRRERLDAGKNEIVPDFAHMPIPIRKAMASLVDWQLDVEVHTRFAEYCRCDKNDKMDKVAKLVAADKAVSFTRYAEQMIKLKGENQWKARGLKVGVPPEATLQVKSPSEALRLLAVRFLYEAEPGDNIGADLKSRSFFVDAGCDEWLASQ